MELLIPFSVPPDAFRADLSAQLSVPSLSMLMARAQQAKQSQCHQGARALPHELWLAKRQGWMPSVAGDTSPSVALDYMNRYAIVPDAGFWFVIQPVHLHIARDHLVLTDHRQLTLSEEDARALFDVAQGLCAEAHLTLLYGDAHTWFLRSDEWHDLVTATPDAACGHNIDIWMPSGPHARAWRQVQNDIQMHWYSHPVNTARETRGLRPVNSVWLWGGTAVQSNQVSACRTLHCSDPEQTWADLDGTRLPEVIVLTNLIQASLSEEWSDWLRGMQLLESNWLTPLLHALKKNQLSSLSLILSHGDHLSEYRVTPRSLRRFWIRSRNIGLCTGKIDPG